MQTRRITPPRTGRQIQMRQNESETYTDDENEVYLEAALMRNQPQPEEM